MPDIIGKQTRWGMSRSSGGNNNADVYRDYKIAWKIKGEIGDGPNLALYNTPGLPSPGAPWFFDNDDDPYAFCTFDAEVRALQVKDEAHEFWEIEQTFSNRPQGRCQDFQFDFPWLEPPRISGTFTRYTEQGLHDRFGIPITYSSFEPIGGSYNEWDANRPQVRIEQNVQELELNLLLSFIDTVNIDNLWGFSRRTVKLSAISWEKLYLGSCQPYYKRIFEFDINLDTWDRDVPDQGTKVLRGKFNQDGTYTLIPFTGYGELPNPNPDNPRHFIRVKDVNGENTSILLNGAGLPAGVLVDISGTGTFEQETVAGIIHIEFYDESDFLQLGIPVDLEAP